MYGEEIEEESHPSLDLSFYSSEDEEKEEKEKEEEKEHVE